MLVESVMTREPKTCTTTDTLHRAAGLMWEADCGVIPVVDGIGRLCGVVTDRDVCMAAYTQGKAPHEIEVGSVMSKLLFTLTPADPVVRAAELFQTHRVRRAPVVNGIGTLVGILSISDLVHAGASGRLDDEIEPDALLAVVHALTKPRQAATPTDSVEMREVIVSPASKSRGGAATPRAGRKPAKKSRR